MQQGEAACGEGASGADSGTGVSGDAHSVATRAEMRRQAHWGEEAERLGLSGVTHVDSKVSGDDPRAEWVPAEPEGAAVI